MYRLNLPSYEIKIAERQGKRMIFDVLRRLLANEVQLQVGDKSLRCDTLLYNKETKPRMIIEYKAPTVALSQKVFDQITVYNILLHVDYLIVSNGMQHICCRLDHEHQQYTYLEDIPMYQDL